MPTRKPAAKKIPSTNAEQRRRFIEAARELRCDESEERFASVLRKVATPTPPKAERQKKTKPREG